MWGIRNRAGQISSVSAPKKSQKSAADGGQQGATAAFFACGRGQRCKPQRLGARAVMPPSCARRRARSLPMRGNHTSVPPFARRMPKGRGGSHVRAGGAEQIAAPGRTRMRRFRRGGGEENAPPYAMGLQGEQRGNAPLSTCGQGRSCPLPMHGGAHVLCPRGATTQAFPPFAWRMPKGRGGSGAEAR